MIMIIMMILVEDFLGWNGKLDGLVPRGDESMIKILMWERGCI